MKHFIGHIAKFFRHIYMYMHEDLMDAPHLQSGCMLALYTGVSQGHYTTIMVVGSLFHLTLGLFYL